MLFYSEGLTPDPGDIPLDTAVDHHTAIAQGVLGSQWDSQTGPELVGTVFIGQHLSSPHPLHQGVPLLTQPLHLYLPRVEPCHMTCDLHLRAARSFKQADIRSWEEIGTGRHILYTKD